MRCSPAAKRAWPSAAANAAWAAHYKAVMDGDRENRLSSNWQTALNNNNVGGMRDVVWQMGAYEWYEFGRRTSVSTEIDRAAELLSAAGELSKAAELRQRSKDLRDRTKREWEQRLVESRQAAQQARSAPAQSYSQGAWASAAGGSSGQLTPQLSQQQLNYRMNQNLNMQIYGKKWDPYKR